MTSLTHSLAELQELAGERSPRRRMELLRRLTDVFVDQTSLFDARQSAQLCEILSTLARAMESEVRRHLSTRLAALPGAPRGILMELAADEFTVAEPILVDCLTLGDDDLITLSRLVSQEHLEAIARRGTLTHAVTDELVQRGGDGVLLQLASNGGAALSRASLEIMISRATASAALQQPLVLRRDIPPDLLNGMFFIVSRSLRRVILEKTRAFDRGDIERAIEESERALRLRAAADDPDRTAHEALILQLRNSEGSLSEALLCKLANQHRDKAVSAAFAEIAGLDPATAEHVLTDEDLTGLAIACCAARLSRSTFATLALARSRRKRSLSEASEILSLFDVVPFETAQRVMRFWRMRSSSHLLPGAHHASM